MLSWLLDGHRSIRLRIGIDATCWRNPRGFGRFTRELVRHLVSEHPGHQVTLVVDRETGEAGSFPAGANVLVAPTRRHPSATASANAWRSPLDLLRLGHAAARCGADVFWFPAVSHYYPVLGTVPVVVTVHDAMTETRPDLFFPTRRAHAFWKAKVWLACRQASILVTPSESARQAVASALSWPVGRIARVDEAPADVFTVRTDAAGIRTALDRYGIPADVPLVLYVGAIDPHKNLAMLLRAMADLREGGETAWHLALVGGSGADGTPGGHQRLEDLRQALALQRHVTLTGFVPDEDLSMLYNAAALLVLPSIDEGFGLPVVEAMACGVPVAVSARGALPALAGDAGLTFDPTDRADMARVIGRILADGPLRLALGARARSRAAAFSWTASTRQLLAVLEETVAR